MLNKERGFGAAFKDLSKTQAIISAPEADIWL